VRIVHTTCMHGLHAMFGIGSRSCAHHGNPRLDIVKIVEMKNPEHTYELAGAQGGVRTIACDPLGQYVAGIGKALMSSS